MDAQDKRCPFTDDEGRQCVHPEGHYESGSPLAGADAHDHLVLPLDVEEKIGEGSG